MASQLQPFKRHKSGIRRTSPIETWDIPGTPMKLNGETYAHSSVQKELQSSAILEGSRLNSDFDIVDVIGTGSFGTVYRAKGKVDDIIYAVKRSRRRFKGMIDRARMMHEVKLFF